VAAVTVPPGTSDGAHTVYGVTSPSGSTAAAGILVDGTPPPLPELTYTPGALSNGSVSFEYTEAEAASSSGTRVVQTAFTTTTFLRQVARDRASRSSASRVWSDRRGGR